MSNYSSVNVSCFTLFQNDISHLALPKKFTYPFCYEPHPLSVAASEQLQAHLLSQTHWQHEFGLTENAQSPIGKMFGVLVVQSPSQELGFISAFSGKLAEQNVLPHFVPPVFDMLDENGFFLSEQAVINEINQRINALSQQPELANYQTELVNCQQRNEQRIEVQRQHVIAERKKRKQQREQAKNTLNASDIQALEASLAIESVYEKNVLLALKNECEAQLLDAQHQLATLTDQIDSLKQQRKTLSAALQKKLFEQYQFANAQGKTKNLAELFVDMPHPPPAGAGECAAPKLLQYAYAHHLTPIAMAEFWWGAAPKSEVRQHKNFYPACQGKCHPILSHMLQGLTVEDNPLLTNPANGKSVEVIYEDDAIAIINKPAEFLSVPGKNITDSVYQRMKLRYPHATGNLIVHRLDMSTSGLMVIALTKKAHKQLQKQFINRTVVKRYVALVEGELREEEGEISLPLTGDYYDRPRQLVCFESGKPAHTKWQVIERINGRTRVNLYPKTGRTHQLRVHCAHIMGLQSPIVGDDLYGTRSDRLHLHAQYLAFAHPMTKENLSFEIEADF